MSKTVLIIDDSNSALLLTEWIFQQQGFQTETAENAKVAIELISGKKPDLIVLDLMMPGISGYDFLKMRKELGIESVPVIVVSAIDSPESVSQTEDLGAAYFIAKPINTELLVETAKKLLE